MLSDISSLSRLAFSKLRSEENVNDGLRRWVLLKNVLHSSATLPSPSDASAVDSVYRSEEDHHDELEQDSFMFPDPDTLADELTEDGDVGNREDQWLDNLLQDLGDDVEDLVDSLTLSNPHNNEEDEPMSPLYSPMSSSDDLVDQSNFYYPYPIPYPPLHPPLVPSRFDLERSSEDVSMLSTSPPLYHDPLPYSSQNDCIEDLPVPDAIEDTSDDDSDVPSTPSTISTSSLAPADPVSVPLPRERVRLRSHPYVYIGPDDSYFYPFEHDPLPFPDNEHADNGRHFHPLFQEC